MFRLLMLLAVTTVALPVYALWSVEEQSDEVIGANLPVAVAKGDNGHRLDIYRDTDGAVIGRFYIPGKLSNFSGEHCPTFQVDSKKPVRQSIDEKPCIHELQQVEFTLGYVDDENQLVSIIIHRITNGDTLYFRYQLDDGGYQEASFSLSGSKQAINKAIGPEVAVSPR